MPVPPILIPTADLVEAAYGRSRILIYGSAEYDDIFSDSAKTTRHRTEFCAELIVKSSLTPGPNGFEKIRAIGHTMHAEYNGSERECGQRFLNAQDNRPKFAILANLNVTEESDVLTATGVISRPSDQS